MTQPWKSPLQSLSAVRREDHYLHRLSRHQIGVLLLAAKSILTPSRAIVSGCCSRLPSTSCLPVRRQQYTCFFLWKDNGLFITSSLSGRNNQPLVLGTSWNSKRAPHVALRVTFWLSMFLRTLSLVTAWTRRRRVGVRHQQGPSAWLGILCFILMPEVKPSPDTPSSAEPPGQYPKARGPMPTVLLRPSCSRCGQSPEPSMMFPAGL